MSDRRIRLLHCIQDLNYGGMERVLSDLVHGVDPDRFEPHVLTLEYRGRFGEGLDEVATLHDGPRQGWWSMAWPRALTRTIAAIAPDVVHLHSGVWYKAARASRAAGVKRIIYTEHGRVGPEGMASRLFDGLGARYTDRIVAVSKATAVQLREGLGVASDRIEVIFNGVDTDRFAPGSSELRASLGVDESAILLGTVGRLERVKDHETLLRALRLVLDRDEVGVPVHLVMAGDGSLRGVLESLREGLGLDDRVRLLGWWDDPEGLFRALDVFVLSSRSEGTSISLLEALGSGCCPVVTRVGGNPDVLGPALAHRLVEPADPAALAEGLIQACLDEGRRIEDGHVGRRRVIDAFGVGKMIGNYSRLYAGT